MKKHCLLLILILLLQTAPTRADEGMWLLSQLKKLNLGEKGFLIEAEDIYHPQNASLMDAVVLLGGGSSEFVSADGLLLTNHHVAFGAVQRASTGGVDYMGKGFLARSRADEIEAPGYTASVLLEMKDVSSEILKGIRENMHPGKRRALIEKRIKAMTTAREKGRSDISASVASMYEGREYVLFVYRRFDDIRLVYVPPSAIGNYGGEIDNWMWPRHTGDFSFMRVYMAPDGSGRKYHPENVPYRPKNWLRVAREGLRSGDQTFILGFPGRTQRYRSSYSIDYSLNYSYPRTIKLYSDTIELLESFEQDSQVAQAKVAGMKRGLQNTLKNYQGNVEGMLKNRFLEKKRLGEKIFTAWVETDSSRSSRYGDILPAIARLYDRINASRDYDDTLAMFSRLSGTLPGLAGNIVNTVREREKPRRLRDPLFNESDVERTVSRLGFTFMSFYQPADQALLKRTLKTAAALPAGSRIKAIEPILAGDIDEFVSRAYAETRLKDPEFAKSLFTMKSRELQGLGDPLIDLALKLYPELEAQKEKNREINSSLEAARRKYIKALAEWQDREIYPDANRTPRFSYGRVQGYHPRDAVYYKPFTTLLGALEKDSGKEPFDLPAELRQLHREKDFGAWACPELQDVPIAFTHAVDSTGGNSGSPVLNARGELVGILFDGNWEAITSDWQYEPETQRSISVDIRYVLFITEKLAGATHILREMGLE